MNDADTDPEGSGIEISFPLPLSCFAYVCGYFPRLSTPGGIPEDRSSNFSAPGFFVFVFLSRLWLRVSSSKESRDDSRRSRRASFSAALRRADASVRDKS